MIILVLTPFFIYKFSKIIWLGDLNYRLAVGCGNMHDLLRKHDWEELLEKDQVSDCLIDH